MYMYIYIHMIINIYGYMIYVHYLGIIEALSIGLYRDYTGLWRGYIYIYIYISGLHRDSIGL